MLIAPDFGRVFFFAGSLPTFTVITDAFTEIELLMYEIFRNFGVKSS